MQSPLNTIKRRSNWVTAASISAAFTSTYTLIFLILIWFVWKLPETLGGWEGIKLNPYSLIDVFILFLCALGLWMQNIWFARMLVTYQAFDFIVKIYSLTNGNSSLFGIVFSLITLLLYIKALYSISGRKRLSGYFSL